jgi:hypothetical protein
VIQGTFQMISYCSVIATVSTTTDDCY